MGLDGVEIVMKVEETFSIAIADDEAFETVTPRQLVDLVLSKVGTATDEGCLTQRAFHRLRYSLMQYFGIQRSQIRPDTFLASLFPRSTRKEDIQQVWKQIGLSKEIQLFRPTWLMASILTVIFAGGLGVGVFLTFHPIISQNHVLNVLLWPLPFVGAVLFISIFCKLAFFATSSVQLEFGSYMTTIGQLTRWIVANAPDTIKSKPGQWSREQVSEIVRQIVIDTVGCEKEYREDAHFVKDLGVD